MHKGDTLVIRRNHSRRAAATATAVLSVFAATTVFLTSSAHAQSVWQEPFGSPQTGDTPSHAVVDSHDNILVVGQTEDSSGNQLLKTIKYDSAGHQLWTQTASVYKSYNFAESLSNELVATDSSNNVYVYGHLDYELYGTLTKYSSSGKLYSSVTIALPRDADNASFLLPSLNGDVTIGGSGFYYNDDDGVNYVYWSIERFDATGKQIWGDSFYGDEMDSDTKPEAATMDAQGNLIATGDETTGGTTYLIVRKYDPTGNVLYSDLYQDAIQPNSFSNGAALAVDAAGDAYVAGSVYNEIDDNPYNENSELLVTRIAPDGGLRWARHYSLGGSQPFAAAQQVTLDHSGNILVGGSATGNAERGYSSKRLLLKYAPDGHRLWVRHGDQVGENGVTALYASHRTDDFYVVDSYTQLNPATGYYTNRFVAADKFAPGGNLDHEEDYTGSPNNPDQAVVVSAAFDPLLDALYTLDAADVRPGNNYGDGGEIDWFTIKYRLGG